MALSNFPNGFPSGLNVRGTPILNSYANKVFWVDSVNGSDGNRGTVDRPLATIAKAVTFCTASRGDIIMLKPKHAETITAAGGIALSVAGISLVGVGVGNQRPTITYTTSTAATMTVTAADVSIENILFIGNLASVVTAIDVTAVNLRVVGCEFRDTDATHGLLRAVKATGAANTADGLQVLNCQRYGLATAGAEFVSLVDNVDRLRLEDNISYSLGTAGCFLLSAGTKIVSNASIGRNKHQTAGTSGNLFISNGGSTNQTGLVFDNYCGNLDVTGAQTFGAATGLQFINNLMTSTSTESGALSQAADTPLS